MGAVDKQQPVRAEDRRETSELTVLATTGRPVGCRRSEESNSDWCTHASYVFTRAAGKRTPAENDLVSPVSDPHRPCNGEVYRETCEKGRHPNQPDFRDFGAVILRPPFFLTQERRRAHRGPEDGSPASSREGCSPGPSGGASSLKPAAKTTGLGGRVDTAGPSRAKAWAAHCESVCGAGGGRICSLESSLFAKLWLCLSGPWKHR